MIKSINSHRELQNICNMSPWHDLMYSCIDTISQRKHCKALSRHPVVITLWFSITIWHYFYLPSLSSYSWLLGGVKVSHTVYLFHSFSNPLFTRFFVVDGGCFGVFSWVAGFFFCYGWFSVTWFYLFIILWLYKGSGRDLTLWVFSGHKRRKTI